MTATINSGSTTRQTGGAVSSFTLTIDAGSGTDRRLVVGLVLRGNPLASVTAITYNGVALTLDKTIDETSQTIDLRAEIYSLAAPATGSNTLSVTFSGSVSYECQATVFNGAKQTSGLDQTGSDTSASGSAPSISLTPTEDGEILFGICIHEDVNALSTGADETTLYNNDNGAWVTSSSYAIQTTATTQAVNWSAGGAANYAAVAVSYKAEGGGTLYTVSVSGGITPAGTLNNQVQRSFSGSIASAGALSKQAQRAFAGGVSLAGALANMVQTAKTGSVALAGTLIQQANKALSGTVTSAGTLANQAQRTFAGAIALAGTLTKEARIVLNGGVAPTGEVSAVRAILISLAGSIASAGTLIQQANKALSGSVATQGTLTNQVQRTFAGTVNLAGTLTKQVQRGFGGVIGLVGAIANALATQQRAAVEMSDAAVTSVAVAFSRATTLEISNASVTTVTVTDAARA